MPKTAVSVSRWRYLLLIPVILFFALSWQKSFTGDEGLTVYLASGNYSHLLTNVGADFHVPGYYTALWLVLHIFGSSMLVLRLFSLMLILCIPFALRSTIPQRCTFDRDYLQVAQLAIEESRMDSLPVMIFLDSYSVLGVKMHMNEQGFSEDMIWHPHITPFRRGAVSMEMSGRVSVISSIIPILLCPIGSDCHTMEEVLYLSQTSLVLFPVEYSAPERIVS